LYREVIRADATRVPPDDVRVCVPALQPLEDPHVRGVAELPVARLPCDFFEQVVRHEPFDQIRGGPVGETGDLPHAVDVQDRLREELVDLCK